MHEMDLSGMLFILNVNIFHWLKHLQLFPYKYGNMIFENHEKAFLFNKEVQRNLLYTHCYLAFMDF
jgi:hypothetical protein